MLVLKNNFTKPSFLEQKLILKKEFDLGLRQRGTKFEKNKIIKRKRNRGKSNLYMRVENAEILLKIIHNCVVWYETNSPYTF